MASPEPSQLPLTPTEFEKLMARAAPFPASPHMAVAVSGGADSMALLLLVHQWVKNNHGSVMALSVDHGLRPEAAHEVRQVKLWCEKLEIAHVTLDWQPPLLTSAISEQARDARYHLLTDTCKKHRCNYLLTAHHQGDQAETMFFRLARGSGLDGLACIAPVSHMAGITLIRPLLNIPKSRLIDTLKASQQPWIEDPSNQNMDYTRNRIRAALAATGQADALCQRAAAVANTLLKFRNLLENKVARKLTLCTTMNDEGHIILNSKMFLQLEPEYGLRVTAAIASRITGDAHKPRTHKLERFYAQLCTDIQNNSQSRRSFARCLFVPSVKKGIIIVRAEAGRNTTRKNTA